MSSIEYRVRVSVVAELGDEQVFLTDQNWSDLSWGLGNAGHLINGVLGDQVRVVRSWENFARIISDAAAAGGRLRGQSWGAWSTGKTCHLEVQVISVDVPEPGEYLGER